MTSYKVVTNFLKNYIKQYVIPKERLNGSDKKYYKINNL